MNVKEGGIKRLVLTSSTIVIITITIVVSFFLITTENKNFQEEVIRIEKDLTTNRKYNIENRLQSLLSEITFDQSLMRELQLNEVKNFVRTLQISLLANPLNNNISTIRQILLSHDRQDSINGFAFYDDGTLFWSPKSPESQGLNFIDIQDIYNNFYIKEMIRVAKSGQDIPTGFSWYNPGETSISSNIAYVRYLPKLKLIVGAYRSETSINKWIQQTILKKLRTHLFSKESLFFIDYLQSYNMQGDFLTTLLSLGNPKYIKALKINKTKQLIGKTFLDKGYSGLHVNTFTHESEQYLLYTTILPKWRWVIGLGENLKELSTIKEAQLSRAKINRDIKITQLSVLAFTIAIIFFILSIYLARSIEKLLLNYRQRADAESDKYQALYQHSNDSFLLAKEDGLKIIDGNPKALHLTSLNQDELKNTTLKSFFPNLNYENLQTQNSGYERTKFINLKDKKKTVEFTFVWILLQNQKVIFVSIRDITERMKLVNERKQQEQLLIQQSKMAAMGEMLGNIAHQWRQPLSQLSSLFMDLDFAYTFGELNKKYMNKSINEANDTIEYMSKTIDNFKNFYNPNVKKEKFSLFHSVNNALKIISSSLEYNNIKVTFNVDKSLHVEGLSNEFSQVILNLISNSQDIAIQREILLPQIDIFTQTVDNKILLHVKDNCGGIDKAISNKIFEPYFTTKFHYGTGIGLYMSKLIIENKMNGAITFQNLPNAHIKFTIHLNRQK